MVAVAEQFYPLGLTLSYMTQSEFLTIDKVALTKSIFNTTDNTSTPYLSSYTACSGTSGSRIIQILYLERWRHGENF